MAHGQMLRQEKSDKVTETASMKRKALTILLTLIMIFAGLIPMPDSAFEAYAYTSKTRDEAIEWVQSQLGVGIDYDGVYGEQCVDLIKAYYNALGVAPVRGNGKDYATNSLPDGWSRVQGGTPEKGDILVYDGNASNEYGHVAIYESDYETYHQNFNGHGYVEKVTAYSYKGFSNSYWGYIRPDWAAATEPTEVPEAPGNLGTSDGGTVYKTDDFIKFVWDASAGADRYCIYMMKDGAELYSADVGKLRSFTASPLDEGGYTFVVKAENSIGFSDAAEFYFEINDAPGEPWWKVDRDATVTDVYQAEGQGMADLGVVLKLRFSDGTKKLRADWYAGRDGEITADTPVFREEKAGDEVAFGFAYSVPFSSDVNGYNTYQCVIRELDIFDENETTISSDVVNFRLIGKENPDDPGRIEPVIEEGPVQKPAVTAPRIIKDLRTVRITRPKAAKKKVTVKWKKLSGKEKKKIQGIEVQWSRDGFKTIAGTKYVKKSKSSVTIKGLRSKKKYWIRIRAYRKAGKVTHVSAWKARTVKVK